MHLTTCTPADLPAYFGAAKLTVPERVYAQLVVQVGTGDAWCVSGADGEPVALCGIYGWADREGEAWFMCDRPRMRQAMTTGLAAMRQVLRGAAPAHALGVITRVRPGNRAGEVIARYLGFAASGQVIDEAQIWRFAA